MCSDLYTMNIVLVAYVVVVEVNLDTGVSSGVGFDFGIYKVSHFPLYCIVRLCWVM